MFILKRDTADWIYGPDERAALASLFDLDPHVYQATDIDLASPLLSQTDVIFSGWGAPKLDDAFFRAAPQLKALFYASGTVRGFVTDAVWNRPFLLSSAWAANAIPVADFTLAEILISLKHGWSFIRHAHAHGRHRPHAADPLLPGLYRSRVGLLSLGMIGRLVAERLRPFDLEVVAWDPFVSEAQSAELGVQLLDLPTVFATADVVSLHSPLLPETTGLLGAEHFSSMKPGATFINTARGAIVREPELIDVLRARPDLTAVLDVTNPEPPAPDSPLWSLPNVVLTPHIAGSQFRECRRMGQFMVDEARRFLRGEPLRWHVTRSVFERMA